MGQPARAEQVIVSDITAGQPARAEQVMVSDITAGQPARAEQVIVSDITAGQPARAEQVMARNYQYPVKFQRTSNRCPTMQVCEMSLHLVHSTDDFIT